MELREERNKEYLKVKEETKLVNKEYEKWEKNFIELRKVT
jgi:hypothetical protein